MKFVAQKLANLTQEQIADFERNGQINFDIEGQNIAISVDEVEFISKDVPGWLVASDGKYTVALDITITEALKKEGFARELINKIQNYRKEQDFNVTDKIKLLIATNNELKNAIEAHKNYIATQTLATSIDFVDAQNLNGDFTDFDINSIIAKIKVEKE
jgi:isoleucyl-tRNA synthetase